MTFFFDITNRKDKPVLLNAEEKAQANSIAIESIKRMKTVLIQLTFFDLVLLLFKTLLKNHLTKKVIYLLGFVNGNHK
jgi:hypothetical protein